jgi:hypothetical protein
MHIDLSTLRLTAKLNTRSPNAFRTEPGRTDEFSDARVLDLRLREQPDIRTDKLEEAQRMVADRTYPPPETIQKLALLLAMATGGA